MKQIPKLSLKNILWQIEEVEPRATALLQQRLDLPEIIARILCSRGVNVDEANDYLNPTLKTYLPDPLHLLDMDIASKRIAQAVMNNEKIVIYGDYDVDGATSSALLKKFLVSAGSNNVSIYIPDRITEGYGPNSNAFRKFKAENVNLVITVDCGTVAYEPIKDAKEMGLDVIIVDHHLSTEILPEAIAVVNPNRFDEKSECKFLAAVGVSFLVAVATNACLRNLGWFTGKEPADLLSLLDIVALGTICDMVPLEGINRAFVVQGLKVIAKRTNVGFASIYDLLKIQGPPSPYHLGYIIGPRINAGGRVGQSDFGAKLLSHEDYDESLKIAEQLNIFNSERKAIESLVLEEAMIMAEQVHKNIPLILVHAVNWHPGVIGIIASRIKERFNKPAAVITINDKGIGKASCRSIKGLDFGSAIASARALGLVIEGGGHAMAGGFTVHLEKLELLHEYFIKKFRNDMELLNGENTFNFSGYLSTSGITLNLAKMIEQAGPYGTGNHEPRFIIPRSYIVKANIVGTNHVSCLLSSDTISASSRFTKAMAFNAVNSDIGDHLLASQGRLLDIVGYLRISRWHGNEKPEFVIEDVIVPS
jgi:single-stranded-DNA-specific exonuclease